ncbi:MAG: M20/M25/M40 family metallo-hydrolase [Bacteroidetes bacterium]|nr:M20/M25/M40 family metallo-hydrolase [Bacteroidota bacterium]
MKKILLGLLVVVVALVAVVVIKTKGFKSKQIVAADGKRKDVAIDSAAVAHLSDAIKMRTISYDDTAMMVQATYDSFFTFLKTTYPLVFEKLGDTIINQRSMLLTWNGKNTTSKPVIYYAHLDVVPIEETTLKEWKHDAFSGDVAEGYIWGRGTLDDKGAVISLMEAANKLLAKGFTPERTVYFAFGSDEEAGGMQGAAKVAEYFKAQGTKFEFYIDEGGLVSTGLVPNIERPVALIGTAEKGYITLELSVNMPGGHSSRPPRETAMDVLVAAVKKLHDNPDQHTISEPVDEFLQYVGPEMKSPFNAVFANRWLFKPLIMKEYEKSAEGYALLRTTEVATVFNAGVKENLIPTQVSAKVNYRVLTGQTTKDVIQNAKDIIEDPRVIVTPREVSEPSKHSNSSTYGFQLLQKTAAEVFPDAIVTPFLMIGSTDSKHFQDITENTYRFLPVRMEPEQVRSIHGINEKVGVKDYMETISFFEVMLTNLK